MIDVIEWVVEIEELLEQNCLYITNIFDVSFCYC